MLGHIFLDQIVYRKLKILCRLQRVSRLAERLRHNGVESGIGAGHGIRTAHHAEFKLVSGEGKGRSPVSVRGVLLEFRNRRHSGLQFAALQTAGSLTGLHQLLHYVLQLLPQKYGDDGRRRFVRTQPMVVSHVCGALAEQIRMGIHRLHDAGQNQKKLNIGIGRVSGIQQIDPIVRSQ